MPPTTARHHTPTAGQRKEETEGKQSGEKEKDKFLLSACSPLICKTAEKQSGRLIKKPDIRDLYGGQFCALKCNEILK